MEQERDRPMEPMLKALVMPLELLHQAFSLPINLMAAITKGGPFIGSPLPGPL
jgi:hypothetical protein